MLRALLLLSFFAAPALGQPADLPRHALLFGQHSDATRAEYDVWMVCADGTQAASLVTQPGNQYQLAVTPDGSAFAYTSREGTSTDIWRKPFGRGAAVNLTNYPANDSGPAFSPDGTRMAFFSDRDTTVRAELYVLDLATNAVERVTDNAEYDGEGAWAPDGRTFILTRYFNYEDGTGAGEIMTLDLDTGAKTQLTRLGGYNGGLSFSPDGTQIAFHHVDENGSDLWLMRADGTDARPLTDTFVDEYSPVWSPDGRWLAFTAGTGDAGQGTFDLWLMRPDGTDRHLVHAGPNTQSWPTWRTGERYCR